MQLDNMDHFRDLDEKVKKIGREEMICEEYMMEDAEYVIAAFGAPARYGIDSVKDLRTEGYKVGMIRPVMLCPFPGDVFQKLLPEKIKGVLAVEMCIPVAFYHDVREYVPDAIPVESCATAGGIIADCDKIEEAFRKYFGNK